MIYTEIHSKTRNSFEREIFMKCKNLFLCTFFCLAIFNFASCYRMPTEEDYSVVPSVNNPDVTREKPSNNFTPSMGF